MTEPTQDAVRPEAVAKESTLQKVKRWEYVNVALVLAACGALAGFYSATNAHAEKAASSVRTELVEHKAAMRQRLDAHVNDEMTERYEVRREVRGLYNYLVTAEPQPVLERPLPPRAVDGGQ